MLACVTTAVGSMPGRGQADPGNSQAAEKHRGCPELPSPGASPSPSPPTRNINGGWRVEVPALPLLRDPKDLQEITGGTPSTPERGPSCTLPGASSPEPPRASGAVQTHRRPWGGLRAPRSWRETLSCDGGTKCIKRC